MKNSNRTFRKFLQSRHKYSKAFCGCFHKKSIENSSKKLNKQKMIYIVQNRDDLNGQIKNAGDKLIVIDFYASWCAPCKIISPTLEELAAKYVAEAVVLKVNVDDCEDIAMDYKVTSMPTFVFIKNGQIIDTIVGSNAERLVKNMDKYVSGDYVPALRINENENDNENSADEDQVGAALETAIETQRTI